MIWLGTSWKMTKMLADARAYAGGMVAALRGRDLAGVQPFIIPPFTALAAVADVLAADPRVLLGAQNAHWEDAGAWTGEISMPQVVDAGARLVEIGHSERREHFGETVHTTGLKVRAALRHGLRPLLCVGEPASIKDAGGSTEYILHQARGALDGLSSAELANVVIAYEPIWAIGEHGRPATDADLTGPVASLATEFGDVEAILYGGSVHKGNIAELLTIPGIDGLFVGRAAWQLQDYLGLLEIAERTAMRGEPS